MAEAYSPNLFEEIMSLKEKKSYLITNSFEDKIKEILSYLLDESTVNSVINKTQILKYLEELFKNIEFNSDIFLSKTSNGNENLNLFEVIIHEYVINTKSSLNNPSEEDIKNLDNYILELKNIFSKLLSKVTLDKKTYHYIFSFLTNYINQKNNNIKTNQKLNSEQISRILELIHIYYQCVQTVDEPYSYLYFNNNINEENKSRYLISVSNKENINRRKILNFDDSLNIVMFLKLIPNEYIKDVEPNHNCGLLELVFSDQTKNISFNIDNENNLVNNITQDKIVKLEENKFINILIKLNLKESFKIEVYIDNKKVDFKNDQIAIKDNEKAKIKEKYEIKSINFFKNFIGQCTNIILYKNKKVEGLPKFFLHLQNIEPPKPKANTISALFDSKNAKTDKNIIKQELVFNQFYKYGIYNEDYFNILLKQELKDDVEQSIIDNALKTQDKTPLNDIKDFLEKIIAIYIPSRIEIPNNLGYKNYQNSPQIILKDSINNLDAIFIKNNIDESENNTTSNLNGVNIFSRLVDDLNNLGGLNHLIPIIELMNNSPEELLTTENICSFFNLITIIFTPYYRNALKDEKYSNFFFNLSYFLERIPDSFYNSEVAVNIVNISQIIFSLISEEDFVELNKKYQTNILFNQKILFKFDFPEQKKILEQIKSILTMIYSNKKEELSIEMMKIINILLYYDREKYNKFCCKNHSEYFNTKCEIMNPELSEVIKPLEDILKLYFKKYNDETSSTFKDNKDKNIELTKTGYDLIDLFEVLTMDISPCIQKLIIKLFNEFFNENLTQAYKYVSLIEKDGKIFDICLFILKSSVFDIKIDILNLIYLLIKMKNNLTQVTNTKNKDKEILPSVNITGLKEIFIKNNILPYYLIPKQELKDVQLDKIKKQFYISGAQYDYINKTETQNKLFTNFNQNKLNNIILDLYASIYKVIKENNNVQINLNLLVKILSKGDISLMIIFLQHISKEKNKNKEIYDNQNLLHWLLETNFEAFMIKSKNYDKNKYMSRFYFSNLEEKDIKTKIDTLNKLCNDLLIEIFKKNIYKLDYLLTWVKYYNQISLNNNKITNDLVKEFIFKLLIELDKIKIPKEISSDLMHDSLQKEGLYFMNLLFELVTYFKYVPVKNDNDIIIKVNEDSDIMDELSSSFGNILIDDKEKNNISDSLNSKLKYYSFLKKLILYFVPVWNKILKEENDIFGRYIENKKNLNTYISETEILFYQFEDINELNTDPTQKNIVNKGTQSIYILYHFFTLLFNLGGDKEEMKEIVNEFRNFLTFLIVCSCTLTTNIDKKKRKWPKSEDYQMVQLTIKNILYNSFFFFYSNIKKFEEILESNKNLSEKDKDYYLYIKCLLYETFGFLLKNLNRLFRQTKKEEDRKHNKKGVKKIFSKMKGLFSDSEGVKTSGPYFLMEKLYSSLNLDTNFDVKNYLDNIPHIDFKSKEVKNTKINPKLEECIKPLIKENKIKNFFDSIFSISKDEEELNKNKLYPFMEYIKKRTLLLNWFIPCYDNLPNIECDINNEKNYIIKKLLLVCDYFHYSPYEEILKKNIIDINMNLNKKVLLNFKKYDIEEKTKIYQYVKDKKRLFSFLGIWSNKELFYNKDKYDLKYKLVNHLTEDYARVLLKPILNIDYYLPEFTRFNYEKLFRKKENINEILHSTDLSFVVREHKEPLLGETAEDDDEKEENKKEDEIHHDYNILYDIKLIYYKDLENIRMNEEGMKKNLSNELFTEFIKQKFLSNATQYDIEVDSCLIKSSFHITGVLFNNSKGIGFYSYHKVHKEKEEDYENDRHSCFGSIFYPQNTKYDYYYVNIPYNSIDFILKRRYFYKRNAIEIFTVKKKSYLFRVEENKFKTFFDNIKHYMKSTIEDIYIEYSKFDDKIGFYNKQEFLNLNNGFIHLASKQKEMNLKNIYEKWSKWKISSLKMLMMINIYGNRTYNDLNQYPVFPWIITDYSSNELPMLPNDNNAENKLIRPFNTPMGMMELTEEGKARKENYIEYWKSNEEDAEKEDNYDRYRSNYSTSLYVTYYLVRIFPYSFLKIELQGNNFDDPNRLFNSLSISFNNAISQKSDLRELIPEMFYLPELFYNLNELNLGTAVNNGINKLVGNIDLPPWAKESGYMFINKHRELLESPEISEKINEWLNIIFGSKQKGKEAKKINNLYIKQSYEDYDDEYKKSNLENKIYLNKLVDFGVIPNQIFKNDTYKRNAYIELKNKRQLLPNMTEYLKKVNNNLENEIDIAKELIIEETGFHIFGVPYKLGYCELSKDKNRIYAVTQDKIKVFKRICEKIQTKKTVPVMGPNANTTQNVNTTDNKDQNENKDEGKDIIKLNIEQKKELKLSKQKYRCNMNQAPMVFYNEGRNVALGGYYNGNILVQNVDENIDDKKAKVKYTTIHPTNEYSPIVQMVINNSDNFVICGNTLGTIYIYIINQNNKSEWTLYKTLHDHQSEITSISINENLNIFITCSRDGYCMLYTLPNCHQINSFRITDKLFSNEVNDNSDKIYYPNISIISHTPLPCIVFYIELRQSLSVFSINGHFIKEKKIEFTILQNGIKKYTDTQFKDYLLIYNSNNNCIDVYNILDLKSVLSLPIIGHSFVDFIFSKQLDHILILVKYKGKNEEKNNEQINIKTTYKILIMRNPNCEIDWK